MKKRLKITGFIIAVSVFCIAFFPTFFLRNSGRNFFDEIIEILGIAFILFGQLLRVSARGYKSEHSSNGYALIQDGPYSLVRNPMYLGILLIGCGIVIVLFNWWVIFIFLVVFIARYILLIFQEEKKLASYFSEVYADYCKKVPRLLPSLSSLLNRDIAGYLPFKLTWLKKEIGSMITLLLCVLVAESWEELQNQGLRGYFMEVAEVLVIILLFTGLVYYLNRYSAGTNSHVPN